VAGFLRRYWGWRVRHLCQCTLCADIFGHGRHSISGCRDPTYAVARCMAAPELQATSASPEVEAQLAASRLADSGRAAKWMPCGAQNGHAQHGSPSWQSGQECWPAHEAGDGPPCMARSHSMDSSSSSGLDTPPNLTPRREDGASTSSSSIVLPRAEVLTISFLFFASCHMRHTNWT
jgi:hypothetical protein